MLVQIFQALCVGSADEICLHVKDAPIRVHQVLSFFALDLDHAHDDAVDHVDALAALGVVVADLRPSVVLVLYTVIKSIVGIPNDIFLEVAQAKNLALVLVHRGGLLLRTLAVDVVRRFVEVEVVAARVTQVSGGVGQESW